MKVVVTSNGQGLDAPASPVFGRSPWYVLVDTDTMEVETMENPAVGAASGAGIQAAQFVLERGAEAVVSGSVGPNAFEVFRSAEIPVYVFEDGTVRDAIDAWQAGRLPQVGGPTGPAHAGLGGGRGMGGGAGRARRTPGRAVGQTASPASVTPSGAAPGGTREKEVAELKQMAADLRGQLVQVMERLDKLEEGE